MAVDVLYTYLDSTENGDSIDATPIIVHHYFLPNGVTCDARPRVMSLYSRIDVNTDSEYLVKKGKSVGQKNKYISLVKPARTK